MSDAPPMEFTWDGEHMVPHRPRFADRHYVVGEVYRLVDEPERSLPSQRQYFAALHEIWQSLPDALALEYPTEDIFRKRALIATGFFSERRLILSSPAEARKVAAFLKNDCAVLSVAGCVVVERVAKSQKMRGEGAMQKEEFQRSKQAVLEWASELIGTKPADAIEAAA